MRKFVIFILAAVATFSSFAKDGNPANRYLESYKKYVNATCPVPKTDIRNFVYVSRDRQSIIDNPFLKNPRFAGAQIMYSWAQLEPKKGQYDFSMIRSDLSYLQSHGKTLFIQLQDATFSPKYKAVPSYLLSSQYDGGVTAQYDDNNAIEGWVAKRWNEKVRERFALLLAALGKGFDGKIEGINLQETAIGVSHKTDSSFTDKKYVKAIEANMLALKKSFPKSVTMQYANFMPGEWLPWDDKGYLKSIYAYGEKIGVGLGAPDLMVKRKGQLNHALAMMHEHQYTVPLGIAVQDGNYIGETNNTEVQKKAKNLVPMLSVFAHGFLKVNYMFWVNQEPYFEQDVLPCFSSNP